MTARSWEQAVREQVGLGRLLPLGDAADGAWLAERAAAGVLRRAAAAVRGARVTVLRVEPADRNAEGVGGEAGPVGDAGAAGGPGEARRNGPGAGSRAESVRDGGGGAVSAGAEVRYLGERGRGRADAGRRPAVGPPPVSALPYGELRITAECEAATDRPMTATAEALREALWRGAEERLGLRVAAVDIHVAGLLGAPQNAAQPDDTYDTQTAAPGGSPRAEALRVPGVLDLDVREDGDHAEVRAVTDARHRALDVATAVRVRIPAATVTVLITDIR